MRAGVCAAAECSGPTFPGYDYCYHCHRANQHARELAIAQAEREKRRELAKQQRKERKAAERTDQSARTTSQRSGPRRRSAPVEKKPGTSRPRTAKHPRKTPSKFWICGHCGVVMDNAKARCVSCGRWAVPSAASTRQGDRGRTPQGQGPVKESSRRVAKPRSPVGTRPLQNTPKPAIVKAPPMPRVRALKPPPAKLPERSPGWWETNDRW